jgi:hypothetical protein
MLPESSRRNTASRKCAASEIPIVLRISKATRLEVARRTSSIVAVKNCRTLTENWAPHPLWNSQNSGLLSRLLSSSGTIFMRISPIFRKRRQTLQYISGPARHNQRSTLHSPPKWRLLWRDRGVWPPPVATPEGIDDVNPSLINRNYHYAVDSRPISSSVAHVER